MQYHNLNVFGYQTQYFSEAVKQQFESAIAKVEEWKDLPEYIHCKSGLEQLAKLIDKALNPDHEMSSEQAHALLQNIGIYNYKSGMHIETGFVNKELAERHLAKGGPTTTNHIHDGCVVVYTLKGKTYGVEADTSDQAELIFDALVDYMNKRIKKSELMNTLQSYMSDEAELLEPSALENHDNKYYSGFYEKEIPVLYKVDIDKKTTWESPLLKMSKGGTIKGPVVDGHVLIIEMFPDPAEGSYGTIRTEPQNYYVATIINEKGDLQFDDLEANTKGIDKEKVRQLYTDGKIPKRKIRYNKGGQTNGQLPTIVSRAVLNPITDIGQLSASQKRELNKYVKKGLLDKGIGGAFPKEKTVYAIKGFDFKKNREETIKEMLDKVEKLEPGTVKYSKKAKGGLIGYMEDSADKIINHYLPGHEPEEMLPSEYFNKPGQYRIDNDTAGDGSKKVFVEVYFGDAFDAANTKLSTDYDNYSQFLDNLASKKGFDAEILTVPEKQLVVFCVTKRNYKRAKGGLISYEAGVDRLIGKLTDIAIDLEGEDETSLAALRLELEDANYNSNIINKKLIEYKESWLDDLSDPEAKRLVKEAITEFEKFESKKNIKKAKGGIRMKSVTPAPADQVAYKKHVPGSKKRGGRVSFNDKTDAIADSLLGKTVPKKYQKEYGKKYNKKDARKAAKKIAGSLLKKENLK